jgi:LPXTG-site transpeptidase (sortase) family protein
MTKIPLLLRVVSLYILIGTFIWTVKPPEPKPILASAPVVVRQPQPSAAPVIEGVPSTISVPRLGMDLTIVDGTYNATNDSWTLTDDKAQFATMTDLPNNQSGSTFIYGHNTDQVFAKLSGLSVGDIAQIKTTNGRTFNYIYNGQEIVQPSSTQILSEKPATPRLTLMTCEGILSLTRRVMFFDFKEVV